MFEEKIGAYWSVQYRTGFSHNQLNLLSVFPDLTVDVLLYSEQCVSQACSWNKMCVWQFAGLEELVFMVRDKKSNRQTFLRLSFLKKKKKNS